MLLIAAFAIGATPALCPGDFAYAREVSRAASLLRVTHQLYVQVVPNKQAPEANSVVKQKAIAWVYKGRNFDWTIRIRYDMFHAMSCQAYRLSALHEVCHIALGHVSNDRPLSYSESMEEEKQTDTCVKRFLSDREWLDYNQDLSSAVMLSLREKIEPDGPYFEFVGGLRQAVP